jgi:hypothetical protein
MKLEFSQQFLKIHKHKISRKSVQCATKLTDEFVTVVLNMPSALPVGRQCSGWWLGDVPREYSVWCFQGISGMWCCGSMLAHQDTQTPLTNGYAHFAIYLFKVIFDTLIPPTTRQQLLIRTAPINPLLFQTSPQWPFQFPSPKLIYRTKTPSLAGVLPGLSSFTSPLPPSTGS